MSEITSVSISDDAQSFAVTLQHSFQIYSVETVKRKFLKDFVNYTITHITTFGDGTIIAFSVRALGTDASQGYKVFIWNNQYGEGTCQLTFKEEVVNLLMNQQYLLIVLVHSIVIYDIDHRTTQLEQITAANKRGAADCTPDQPLIACCGLVPGAVHVSEIMSDANPVVFQAHQHPLAIVKFSPDGSLLATSSEKGTLIRLFDAVTGTQLSSYRRGSFPSNILAMCISPSNSVLIAVSDNGTAHLFPADERNGNLTDPPRSVAKTKIEKGPFVRAVFGTEELLYILSSSGHLHKIRCTQNQLTALNKYFVLAH